MNLRSFNLYRVYLDLLNVSNAGDFSWSWILKDFNYPGSKREKGPHTRAINSYKIKQFGRVRQVPIRELRWEFPGWDLSHFAKNIQNGNPLFFPVKWFKQVRGPAAKQANMQTSSSFVRPVLYVICQNTPESSTIVFWDINFCFRVNI